MNKQKMKRKFWGVQEMVQKLKLNGMSKVKDMKLLYTNADGVMSKSLELMEA